MMRKVTWSPEAANDYERKIDYFLESNLPIIGNN